MTAATSKVQWETTEGETFGYLDDGREINITARTRANRWGESDSNVREWFLLDADNNRVANGKAEGLRAAKAAATAALTRP
jgi:hypothetical protein